MTPSELKAVKGIVAEESKRKPATATAAQATVSTDNLYDALEDDQESKEWQAEIAKAMANPPSREEMEDEEKQAAFEQSYAESLDAALAASLQGLELTESSLEGGTTGSGQGATR